MKQQNENFNWMGERSVKKMTITLYGEIQKMHRKFANNNWMHTKQVYKWSWFLDEHVDRIDSIW